MDPLNRLTRLLNKIRITSEKIVKTIVPIMEELAVDGNDFVEEITNRLPNINEKAAAKLLQDSSLELVHDAKVVRKEIDEFAKVVILGEEAIESSDCSFFQQIWFGDMYEADKSDGLEKFLDDLEKQLETLNDDKVLHLAIENYRKGGEKLLEQ